jgi:CheY-like chemotaxis protein
MDSLQTLDLVGTQFNPKHKLLLVEDNHDSEILMRNLCHTVNKNVTVKCVQTGELALHLLEENPNYDLIISDHHLAGSTTGLDLWKVCNHRFKQIPFMMTSGLPKKEFFQMAKCGDECPLYLPKILDIEASKQVLRLFLDKASEYSFAHEYPFELKRFLVDTTTMITIFLVILAPGYLLNTKTQAIKTAPIEEIRMERVPASQKEFEATPVEAIPAEELNMIDVRNIITMDLRNKIDEIVKRADEIRTDSLGMKI